VLILVDVAGFEQVCAQLGTLWAKGETTQAVWEQIRVPQLSILVMGRS
jgi:hypothetical protein